jgi:hypothetical protein
VSASAAGWDRYGQNRKPARNRGINHRNPGLSSTRLTLIVDQQETPMGTSAAGLGQHLSEQQTSRQPWPNHHHPRLSLTSLPSSARGLFHKTGLKGNKPRAEPAFN